MMVLSIVQKREVFWVKKIDCRVQDERAKIPPRITTHYAEIQLSDSKTDRQKDGRIAKQKHEKMVIK